MESLPMFAVDRPSPRVQHIYFIVESSEKMTEEAKATVNAYITEMASVIADWEKSLLHVSFLMALLGFGDSVSWMNDQPIEASVFRPSVMSLEGLPDVGKAFDELGCKLRRNAHMCHDRQLLPVFFLFLYSNDFGSWENSFGQLSKNGYFASGVRIAIDISGSASNEVMESFTGNKELVLGLDNYDVGDLIKYAITEMHRLDDIPIYSGGSREPIQLSVESRELIDETWDWSNSWDMGERDSLIRDNRLTEPYFPIQPYS